MSLTRADRNDFARICPKLEKTVELSRHANSSALRDIADPLIDDADLCMSMRAPSPSYDTSSCLVAITGAAGRRSRLFQTAEETSSLRRCSPEWLRLRARPRTRITRDSFAGDVASRHVCARTTFPEALQHAARSGTRIYEQTSTCRSGVASGHGVGRRPREASRAWENLVGRSRAFWNAFYPSLQKLFPGQLGTVSLDTFYRAINKVARSLTRTNADEVTYGLHVIMRFDFELDLLEGKLAVRDLPEAWRERFRADFGIVPETDSDGVLQDVHWYDGFVGGAFQGYALGNLMSAQFFEAAMAAHPDLWREIESGRFDTLRGWLAANVHRHGRTYLPAELVQRATGKKLSIAPYIAYLRTKYGELYPI
jgi:carboxypeptidase Taq